MKKILILIVFVIVSKTSISQVKWLSIETALEKQKTEKRKIFIDVYTGWCGWCKVMDQQTFTHPLISKILNEKFYSVKFDAESTKAIKYKTTTMVNQNPGETGSTHDFAIFLLKGKLSYPCIVYLDENSDLIFPVPGFQTPEKIEPILEYVNTEGYKRQPYDEFEKTFKSKIN